MDECIVKVRFSGYVVGTIVFIGNILRSGEAHF
jgi:hypothetical protein